MQVPPVLPQLMSITAKFAVINSDFSTIRPQLLLRRSLPPDPRDTHAHQISIRGRPAWSRADQPDSRSCLKLISFLSSRKLPAFAASKVAAVSPAQFRVWAEAERPANKTVITSKPRSVFLIFVSSITIFSGQQRGQS